MKKPVDFYNEFDEKLISDYILGNKRIVHAITNLVKYIPNSSKRILDIGCGLGWSSYEFSRAYSSAEVLGVDFSPVLNENALKLFGDKENLDFKVLDITKSVPEQKYDAVVLIDVYEHISKNDRSQFNKSVKKILNKQGRMILACPTKFHQDYLRENEPEGLQPIDEDVDFNVIHELAEELSGEVIYFEYQTIWRKNDYLHAVIEIQPQYGTINSELVKKGAFQIESQEQRLKRLESKLNRVFKINHKKRTLVNRIIKKLNL